MMISVALIIVIVLSCYTMYQSQEVRKENDELVKANLQLSIDKEELLKAIQDNQEVWMSGVRMK